MSGSSCIYFNAPLNITVEQTLENYLNLHPQSSPYSSRQLLQLGAVYVNTQRVTALDYIVQTKDLIRFYPDPKRYSLQNLESPRIVFQNADFSIVDKPAPLPMHPTSSNLIDNLISLLNQSYSQKFFITSRLDAETKGLVILAHSEESQKRINKLFHDKKIKKIYRAFSESPPPIGRHTHYQSSLKSPIREFGSKALSHDWKSCELIIHSVCKKNSLYLSEVELLTGRTHQIRGQMALLNTPIIGDSLYGKKGPGLMLECFELKFLWNEEQINIKRTS